MEPPHPEMDDMVAELLNEPELFEDVPFVFFGHSLGSRVALALSFELQKQHLPLPQLFIGSGSRAPHTPSTRKAIFHLPDDEFVEELRNLNGTPEEILENASLMELLMPVLRADFKIADTWLAPKQAMPFPIAVLHGEEDTDISPESVAAWSELSAISCDIYHLPGDHFFIDTQTEKVLDIVLPLLSPQ